MSVILGAGLAGLSAGYRLAKAGRQPLLIEAGSTVGGLARTVQYRDFRFDLGGHRFLTEEPEIENLVRELIGENLLEVPRKSQIYMRGKYIDYPLNPLNALTGLGPFQTIKMISDFLKEKILSLFSDAPLITLEDWVVRNFGRRIFDLYFRDYSEKVWGIGCREISQEWVSKRIQGLSLSQAIKNAFLRGSKKGMRTLTDRFLYPVNGIGEIAEKLRTKIEKDRGVILTQSQVIELFHDGAYIKGISVLTPDGIHAIEADEYLSSIPVNLLVKMLKPQPPENVLRAASSLAYRDLVIVTVMLDRERVTDLTWLYLPEREIPFGRIHEPTNWSESMAPDGKTHIVAEFFCTEGDSIWNAEDNTLKALTYYHLSRLGFIRRHSEVIDACVVRIRKSYPLFDLSFRDNLNIVIGYLERFENLHLIGRTGKFSYLNMDHAMASGIRAAEAVLAKDVSDIRMLISAQEV